MVVSLNSRLESDKQKRRNFGFRVEVSGFRVRGPEFEHTPVCTQGIIAHTPDCIQGVGFQVSGLGVRVQGAGYKVKADPYLHTGNHRTHPQLHAGSRVWGSWFMV